jgi:hypothetical protein
LEWKENHLLWNLHLLLLVVWKVGTNTRMVKPGPAPMVATAVNASMEKWHRPRWNAHLEWDLNPEAPKVE